ncbi:Piso0_000098 [Millerozyma farinosa CBS 7064]|uniref:Piso0_000098 protein n=1 Tax=Pichia sorbitophila (strain ATCC MYA-4447 / BCRC 22081 / CBS 7064 / NBRC 10061 / NRRL Y-12695) TaxID=559304 RepID=G8YT33_PICSO|nr:Piso0_000098 [Millerozyma farinosa CBS 7064]
MAFTFSELPDIHDQTQEIYETSDIESSGAENEAPDQPFFQNEEIDNDAIDVTTAREKFSKNVLVGEVEVDFSGRILGKHPIHRSGYQTSSCEEPYDQKLSRIRREVEELRLQDASVLNKKDPIELDQTLTKLEEAVQTHQVDQVGVEVGYSDRIKVAFEQADQLLKQTASQKVNSGAIGTQKDISAILDLEARIYHLERSLGHEGTNLNTVGSRYSIPINTVLQEIERKLNLVLHSPQLTKELEKLRDLSLDTERKSAFTHTRDEDSSDDGRSEEKKEREREIDAALEKIAEVNRLGAIVPSVISRLKTLQTVHSDMANAVQAVNDIDSSLTGIHSDMSRWNDSINQLNLKMDAREETFSQNKKEIIAKIDQLSSRIEALHS